MCRSRRELSNEYLLAKIGVDTAENEPLKVWGKFNLLFIRLLGHERAARGVPADLQGGDGRRALLARARGSARGQRLRAQVARSLVERFDIEPFSDFSAK